MSDYIRAFKQYAEFSGRSRRREYWMFTLFHVIISTIVSVIAFLGGFSGVLLVSGDPSAAGLLYYGSLAVFFIYFAVTLIPSLAIFVRRLHDAGYSGWYLLLSLIPFVGAIVLLIFTLQKSEPGHNQYGPEPMG